MGVLDASRSRPVCAGSSTVDSQHRFAMAHAAAKLSNYKTVHRRFQTWCCNEILRLVLTDVATSFVKTARWMKKNASSMRRCYGKGGGRNGPTKRGKGMKIMAIVDRHGLPLWSARTRRTSRSPLGAAMLRLYMIEASRRI